MTSHNLFVINSHWAHAHAGWCWQGWMKSVALPAELVLAQASTATISSASALQAPEFTTNNKLHALRIQKQ